MVFLGCAKNQVDSERLLGAVSEAGYIPSADVEHADAVVVTTCAFVKPAVEETSDVIDDLSALRAGGGPKLIVAGCMVNRFGREDLRSRFPAVDAFVDLGSFHDFPGVLAGVLDGDGGAAPPAGPSVGFLAGRFESLPRLPSTHSYAYLKISEGCSNCCSYCTIPSIRGPLRHRPASELVAEAAGLAALGARELVVIAQDTASYSDPDSACDLAGLLDRLASLDGLEWIRLMYAHPAHVSPSLVSAFSHNPKLLPYLDLPIQHSADSVLASMGRGYRGDGLRRLIDSLRSARPDIALRTTVMVGHPGEDAAAFDSLLAFLEDIRFFNLGVFSFCPEPGSASASMPLPCSHAEAQRRLDAVMRLQQDVTFDLLDARAGAVMDVIVENDAEARTSFQAPDVDGVVLSDYPWPAPGIIKALVTRRDGYDLKGEPL